MRLTRLLAIATMMGSAALALNPSAGGAQLGIQQPAELPPADYKGKQYVDSQGCVFVRAGIDGDVSWVPRVTRERKTVCGFKPSLEAADPAPVTTASVQSAAVAPVPKPEPETVLIVDPLPEPVVVAEPTPAVVRQAAQAPKPRVQKAVARPAPSMPKPMLVSSVREDGTVVVTSKTRIVPKHVAENRRNSRNVQVPEGYRPIWKDGRLNPRRAEQNLEGRAQMGLVWTNTLPRRLIDSNNGRDVTASVPLIYPYTSVTQQSQEIGEVEIVQRNGKTVKRVIQAPAARQPVYSSRSAPKGETNARFVQVGTFRVPENAQRAAQRIARMGMPARIGKYRKDGTTYLSVQAGPFVKTDQVNQAVRRVRQAGFGDAFIR